MIPQLHLTNGIHEIRLYPCVYTFEKKYRRSENLFRHGGQIHDTRATKIAEVINRYGSQAGNHMPRQQLTRLQDSQTSTNHCNSLQEALKERGNYVRPDNL